MLSYILQLLFCQFLFLLIYDVFLKKETFFTSNRIYLIVSQILALIIPLIKVEGFQQVIPQEYIVKLPAVIIGNTANEATQAPVMNEALSTSFNLSFEHFIILGMVITSVFVLTKFNRIYQYIKLGEKLREDDFWLVMLPNSKAAFSFLNYVFLGEQIEQNSQKAIIKHELIHVKQKHSYDLLFFELLKILMWFNPFVYVYQKQLATLHEYIADSEAIKQESKASMYQNLLEQIFDTNTINFTNTFFKKSLIKKRITMLSKNKSKQQNAIKYLLTLPLIFGMLLISSCNDSVTEESPMLVEEVENEKSPLINKVKIVKEQIQIQGNVTDHEQKGLDLLLSAIKGTEFDPNLVEEVQAFEATKDKSKLTKKIADVFEQIQIQGNITDEEEKVLKSLLVLTADNGLNDPFFEDVLDKVEIPFAVIEQAPIFHDCEVVVESQQRDCTTNNIATFVNKNFNIDLASKLNLTGEQRIITRFVIDKEGNITGVKARAAHPDLAAEAERVIKLLPQMIPGKHKGKAVSVPYSLPILFVVNK